MPSVHAGGSLAGKDSRSASSTLFFLQQPILDPFTSVGSSGFALGHALRLGLSFRCGGLPRPGCLRPLATGFSRRPRLEALVIGDVITRQRNSLGPMSELQLEDHEIALA